jgi:starch-binding outer membrane protein, SusD/RagB family
MKIQFTISLLALMFLTTGCDKMLEFEPGDVILAEDALNTPEDLQLLLNSNYDVIGNLYDGRVQNVAELLTNNLALPETNLDYQAIHNRQTNFFTSTPGGVYTDFYRAVFRSNVVLESFDLIEGLTDADRTRIEAEARFIRAICHFQVVRLWAQPYGYTPNNTHLGIPIREAATQDPLPRSNVNDVYNFIEQDLLFAYDNLPLSNDVYATKYSAAGFLAYMYFLQGSHQNAADYASEVIGSGQFALETTIDRFLQDSQSTETITAQTTTPLLL